MTKQRYYVFLLMFLSVFVNYMDRVNFSVSVPAIRTAFGFSLSQISMILFVWGIIYAVFNLPGGLLVDKLGLRKALPLLLGWWSIFTILTPFARTLGGWFWVRGLMAAGEAPIWPVNAKLANTWAAPSERSTLYTLAGSGQYVGPAVGAMLAGLILHFFGWQWTFVSFGFLGLLILPFWYLVIRDRPSLDPRVNARELAHIGNHAHADEKPDWDGIRNVFRSRTGIGMLFVYLTFGYILFTFLNWMPTYMYDTFHLDILKSALWSSLGSWLGLAGFLISGPLNDRLAKRYDRMTARKIGTTVPMGIGMICILFSVFAGQAGLAALTAILIGLAQLAMNATVGAWAVSIIDISPNMASTGFVYGVYNGVLNVMGAFNAPIIALLATRFGFPAAFGSAIAFMAIFIVSMLFIVDRKSYDRLTARAEGARLAAAG